MCNSRTEGELIAYRRGTYHVQKGSLSTREDQSRLYCSLFIYRLLHHHPEHRARLEEIKDITDEDEMRISETFETVAMDIYQVFDDVINNLEKVDAALRDIKLASESYPLDKRMMRVST